MKPIKPGDVWHVRSGRYSYRRVLAVSIGLYRPRVTYATKKGTHRACYIETFRRWIAKTGARRAQRGRRRKMVLR